jgi:eukaryotic-like serine/threonine-protein kinase
MIGRTIQELTVVRQIGEGGMGAVYLAEDRVLGTRHVVKVLLPQWTRSAPIVDRFVNEARAAAAIRSKNIVSVQRCFQHEGQWVIVMEYLEGEVLSRFAEAQGGPLAAQVVVEIVGGVAAGLAIAHARGIVHRDLKPENIFVTADEDGRRLVKVLDFGIAKLGEIGRGATTRTGMVAGTPAYMAPEQMRDFRSVDARADVYALGVIAFQLATGGRLPFQGDEPPEQYYELSAIEIYERQRSRAPDDPRRYAPGLSERFVRAIEGALAFEPAKRPQTVQRLVLALAEATPGDGYVPSGVDVVRRVANKLLDTDSMLQTIRAPSAGSSGNLRRAESEPAAVTPLPQQYPVIAIAAPQRGPGPEAVTRAERPQQAPTTLGGVASQSMPIERGPRRWEAVLAVAAVGALAVGGTVFLAARTIGSHAVASARPGDATSARSSEDATTTAAPRPPVDAAIDPAASPRTAAEPAQATPVPIDAGTGHRAPPPLVKRETGELEILVQPWAAVSVDGRSVGQTPVHARLPAGRHRVRIENDVAGKDETITVTVDHDRKTTVRRSW